MARSGSSGRARHRPHRSARFRCRAMRARASATMQCRRTRLMKVRAPIPRRPRSFLAIPGSRHRRGPRIRSAVQDRIEERVRSNVRRRRPSARRRRAPARAATERARRLAVGLAPAMIRDVRQREPVLPTWIGPCHQHQAPRGGDQVRTGPSSATRSNSSMAIKSANPAPSASSASRAHAGRWSAPRRPALSGTRCPASRRWRFGLARHRATPAHRPRTN